MTIITKLLCRSHWKCHIRVNAHILLAILTYNQLHYSIMDHFLRSPKSFHIYFTHNGFQQWKQYGLYFIKHSFLVWFFMFWQLNFTSWHMEFTIRMTSNELFQWTLMKNSEIQEVQKHIRLFLLFLKTTKVLTFNVVIILLLN